MTTDTEASADRATETVLLVDDDPTQLKLSRLRLVDAGYRVVSAASAEEAMRQARAHMPDVVVSDVLMAEVDGFGLCHRLRAEEAFAHVPVILLSAHYRGETDRRLAEQVGASALLARTAEFDAELAVVRDALDANAVRVPDAKRRADVYEEHLRANANQLSMLAHRASDAEVRFRQVFKSANDLLCLLTLDGTIVEANDRCGALFGADPRDLVGRHVRELTMAGTAEDNEANFKQAVNGGSVAPVAIRRPDGETVWFEFSSSLIDLAEGPLLLSIGRDVTDRERATQALRAEKQKYRALVERIPDVIWSIRADGVVQFVTGNVTSVLGYTPEEMMAPGFADGGQRLHPDDRERVGAAFHAFFQSGTPFEIEYRTLRKDGSWIWVRNRATAHYERDGHRYGEGMLSDITEKRRLEDSLRQAQKMEAVGQLTGGIAHDFNNILAAILANSHFLIEDLAEDDPRRADAQEIQLAAERAAALTRQLLAFSRRQVLAPTVVDLNGTVGNMEKMLRRLIGEDITFSVVRSDDLGTVRVDVGQMEQVLMNLVVNARDAMPTGGRLSVETQNIDVSGDGERQDASDAIPPGRYVMLAVSDTGCGMSAETKRRLFEPFFTTKGVGQGTGLGLSTSYGIVKQSNGFIWVYSEPGHGSVFKVLLPRTDAAAERAPEPTSTGLHGHETILLVEDDETVRAAVKRMLAARGYRLLVARNTEDAVALAMAEADAIDLVLTDVIMPGLSGPDVVKAVQKHSRRARALFMSGYTDHSVLRDGVLGDGMAFIQKPFAPDALAKRVREVLDPASSA
jgi:PAS domain S-box-containing protein